MTQPRARAALLDACRPVRHRARAWARPAARATLLLCLSLLGCAQTPPTPAPPTALLHDSLFKPPATGQAPDAQRVFELSPAMQAYARTELSATTSNADPRRRLIEALHSSQRLRLSYDAGTTRNAAEAFEARAGNCLSLVIMTAGFARYLGLPAGFQAVLTDDFYSRSGGLLLASGHVNLVLGSLPPRRSFGESWSTDLTVDFLPQAELRGQRTRPLAEATIVSMYFNNRAAELLAAGQLDEAYWFARAAVLQDAGFAGALNTLGVVYQNAGQARAAEGVFRHTLAADPEHLGALSNLVGLLDRQGRATESQPFAARLERLQPVPPFQHFNQGRTALAAGNPGRALELFLAELRRQPYQDEVHFWTAQAYWQLGQGRQAERHLALALEHSTSRSQHDRYAAKLSHWRDRTLQ